MLVPARRLLGATLTALALVAPSAATAQVRQFEACSQGALQNCAGIRLSSQLGAGPSGSNRFDIGIQNLGSQSSPLLATSIYFASFFTGQPNDPAFVDVLSPPTGIGGASVSNGQDWSVFETGDAMFLSSLGNDGIGGCAGGAPVNGFGLMGQTCGANQFITFSFFTTRAFDVSDITLAGLEFVALDANNTADSCNDVTTCTVRDVSVVPEPSSLMLLVAGLSGVALLARRRRSGAAIRFHSEA